MARTTSRREPLRYQVKADKREADAEPGRLYADRMKASVTLIGFLRDQLDKHAQMAASHPNHYGYAGDIGHVNDLLREAIAFLTNGEDK